MCNTLTIEALIQNVSDVPEITKVHLHHIRAESMPDTPIWQHPRRVHSADATRPTIPAVPAEQSGPQRIIYPGETIGVFSLDLGVDQLDLKGTFPAGDKQARSSRQGNARGHSQRRKACRREGRMPSLCGACSRYWICLGKSASRK